VMPPPGPNGNIQTRDTTIGAPMAGAAAIPLSPKALRKPATDTAARVPWAVNLFMCQMLAP
jgi:hypothetical protein